MKIKKYTGHTMSEVLNMIKFEMGPNAVIISRRNVRQKGIMAFFLPRLVEVTAAVEDGQIRMEKEAQTQAEKQQDIDSQIDFQKEILQMKEMLQNISGSKKAHAEKRTGIRKRLLLNDVNESVIDSIVHDIKNTVEGKDKKKIPDSMLIDKVNSLIKVNPSSKGRVTAFIGPTGVGKTTTIAKLAAINILKEKKKVGLLTIDTYRIGAVEQLKSYADILGAPFEAVNNIKDLNQAMDNLKSCDRIYVDTTGRSTKNLMQLSELKLYLERIKPDNICLVVSMTTKYRDLVQILEGFSGINYDSLILTKLDETSTYGSIINLAYNTDVPISYITLGQNVPDDIEKASSEKLMSLVLGEDSI